MSETAVKLVHRTSRPFGTGETRNMLQQLGRL